MKKLSLAITMLALVAFFSLTASAATSTYSFHFRNTAGTPFCDGLTVYLYSSNPGVAPKSLVDGKHWATNCGSAYTNVNGFKAAVSSYYQYSGSGAVLIISDPALGNGALGGTGLTFLVNTTYQHWTLWESGGGAGESVVNYGTYVNGTTADQKGTKSSLQR